MQENICEQCKKAIVGPSNRLVQDTCGHKKCRVCLLDDVEKCKQCSVKCIVKNGEHNDTISSLLTSSDKTILKECDFKREENCAAVIQCNGNAYVSLEDSVTIASTENGAVHFKPTHVSQDSKFTVKSNGSNRISSDCSFVLPKHVTEKTDPLSYYCNICNRTFLTKSHIKYHLYCDGDKKQETKPYVCDICRKGFVLKAQFRTHMNNHNAVKTFSCNICQRLFKEKSKLKRHLEFHSSVRSYTCFECGKSFQARESLKTHSLIHKGKLFGCKLCPARFNNQSNLKRHLVSHSKEKTHMCDQCGKRFKQKWALSIHRKSHLRERPYQCDHCSKSFVNNKDLQRHNLVHADTKGFTCSICGTSFRRKDNLGRHMKNTHPGKKGAVIKNVVKLPDIVPKKPIIDNPNAIHVITAPPAFTKSKANVLQPAKSTDSRPGTVIFGPIKLAFKTPAFKSHYNINRNFDNIPPAQIQKTYDHFESVDICQKIFNPPPFKIQDSVGNCINREVCRKILSPYKLTASTTETELSKKTFISATPYDDSNQPYSQSLHALPKDVFHEISNSSSETINKNVCQKILSPYTTPITPLHYETSFQNRKHALIKNIKFKVPLEYTQNYLKPSEPKDVKIPVENSKDATNGSESTAVTSVIVNNNTQLNVHWRRRTAQNLALKE